MIGPKKHNENVYPKDVLDSQGKAPLPTKRQGKISLSFCFSFILCFYLLSLNREIISLSNCD
jgi:hypothetical protein